MRDWAGQLGSCVYFLCFLSYRPLAQYWAWGGPFCSSVRFASVPPTPPTQYGAMVWVIGPLKRGTGLVFRVRFFCAVLPTPSSAPSQGGGQGNLPTHSGTGLYVLFSFLCDARCFVFYWYFLCVSARHPPPLAGLWVVPPFHFVWVFTFCLVRPAAMISLREGSDFGFPCLRA